MAALAEDKRFEILRGLHPNTLSKSVDMCSGAIEKVATWAGGALLWLGELLNPRSKSRQLADL